MNLPNTTPTPNLIFNGEMKKMGDTEFRIVMIVVRATLGWEIDSETGMRKTEDWISYYQLKQKSGRGYTALAKAIQVCIKRGWIEARDKKGNLLDTKQKRIGKKIWYRLGRIFLERIEVKKRSSESEEDKKPTSSESVITECEAYKKNPIQKKSIAKASFADSSSLKEKKEKLPQTPKKKNPKWAYELVDWLEKKQGSKFANKKQYGALGNLEKAGYTTKQIKECYNTMMKDDFWKKKKPDFVNVAGNITKYVKKNKLDNLLYGRTK